MNLKNCSECNKPPTALFCLSPDSHQKQYYVCSICGKRTMQIESPCKEDEEKIWLQLSEEWNNLN